MGNIRIDPMLYTNVSTDTTILTTAGVFYGLAITPKTTGTVLVHIYDASATATGTLIIAGSMASTAGVGMHNPILIEQGVRCGTGIHADVTCTSGADQVVVFYGPIK